MRLSEKRITAFQKFISDWWTENRRNLPWRRTRDPYKIFVSEVMLQQTQVSRVLPKYKEFLTLFPSVQALSEASPAAVLRAWRGMGYNRRALYLQRAARAIVRDYRGMFPDDLQELIKLPGLGNYTARAVLVFAYKKDLSLIDTNIRRIITHFYFHDTPRKDSVTVKIADQLVPKGKSWEWHQALMDYGALEMPKYKHRVTRKQPIPFKESDRHIRGKIIDRLREASFKEKQFIRDISERFGKSPVYVRKILSKLEGEQLVVRSKTGIIHLPA